MRTRLHLLLSLMSVLLLLNGCKKTDIVLEENNQAFFKQATNFLKHKQASLRKDEANKIDLLISNLLAENVKVIKPGGTELILCNLKTYSNPKNPEYHNTYYKASFYVKNSKILYGYIYSIHTNLTEEEVNSDIENILLFKSPKFTGEIVTHAINDQFLYSSSLENGRLINTKEHRKKEPLKTSAGKANIAASTTCYAYYLVTTYYYDDGSQTQTWQYLFTRCNDDEGHEVPDPNGGGAADPVISMEDVTVESVEPDSGDDGSGVGGGQYAPIKYKYGATKYLDATSGYVENVEIRNTTADPMVSSFVDPYGVLGTRYLTLFGHVNSWNRLTPPLVLLRWSCFVYGSYNANDGRTWSRQWDKVYSAIR